MSLQVWLPMTKDLRQQGLSDIKATNNGAIFNSTGKLGGCYSFGTGASSLSLPESFFTSFVDDFSIACWVKFITWNSSYATVWAATSTSASWKNIMAGLFRSGSSSKILFCIGNDSSSTQSSCITTEDIQLNTWYHFVCTYTSGKICLYQNGILVSSYNTSIIPKFFSTQYFNIGKMRENTYQTDSNISDFRIYNHCLSPMEVKQISQGLVLHYPLNRNGWGQENLLSNTDFDGSSKKYTLTSGTEGGFIYTPITSIISNTKYTVSCRMRGNANMTLYKINTGGNEAVSWVNRSDLSTTDYKYFSLTFTSPNSSKTMNQIYICTRYGAANSQVGDWFEIEPYSLKLEKGEKATTWCPATTDVLYTTMGLNGTIEYDTSGFCNNGIKNNVPIYLSDTVKYSVSTHLNGTNQTIQMPNLSTLIKDEIFTFNIWFKRLQSEPSSKSWETIFGGPGGFEIETCSANNAHDNKIKAYSWGGSTFEFEFDKWNMLTLVRTASDSKFYLNGELKLTGSKGSIPSGNYFIGSWNTTTQQNYKGYVSDVRIYATALSADDVKALYNANKL